MSELSREIAESLASAQRALLLDACVPLGPADIGVVLEEVIVRDVVRHLGPLPTLREQLCGSAPWIRKAVIAQIEAALCSMGEQFVRELCGHPLLDVSPALLNGLFADSPRLSEFGVRIAQRAFERILGERVAPALKHRWAMSADVLAGELPGEFTHAIVFGELVGAVEEIFPLILDAYAADMKCAGDVRLNVVGVYVGWLDAHERATRIFYYNHAAGELYEAELLVPLEFQSCHLLYLGGDEASYHESLVRRLGSRLLFNGIEISRCCDDKFRTAEALRQAGVRTPVATVLRDNRGGSNRIHEVLESSGLARCDAVVVQPNRGTEGLGVKVLRLDSRSEDGERELVACIESLWSEGITEVLVRERVNCLTFDDSGVPRATCVRVNVAWDGSSGYADSGYVQIAGLAEPHIASVARGGIIAPLSSGMFEQLGVSPDELARLRGTAAAAVAAIAKSERERSTDLGLFGVDLLLERHTGELLVWVLEINARPAGLSHSDLLETREPGVSTVLFEFLHERLKSIHNRVKSSDPMCRNLATIEEIEERHLG